MTDARLQRGDYVRVRLNESDDWTPAFVAMASDADPSAVMLMFDGAVRASGGGLIIGALPLTINYKAETVSSLHGDQYELEVVVAPNLAYVGVPPLYVVYDHPRDFPEVFLCRVWRGPIADKEPFMTAATLEEIRDALEEQGLVNIGRYAEDDPSIAEVWI
jgi:hypothetical protein